MNPKADTYFENYSGDWGTEIEKLREILLDCGLTEKLKWRKPCYSVKIDSPPKKESNIVIIQGFKQYCALLFFKGVLLKDTNDILVKTGKNTRVGRQMRFTKLQEVLEKQNSIKTYIQEAIEIEKAGLKVNLEKDSEPYPEELKAKLAENLALKTAFNALMPGRKRGYLLHFSGAKQSKTRISRIEKCIPKILEGKGFQDR